MNYETAVPVFSCIIERWPPLQNRPKPKPCRYTKSIVPFLNFEYDSDPRNDANKTKRVAVWWGIKSTRQSDYCKINR